LISAKVGVKSINQPTNQPTNQSINQSINHSEVGNQTID
jgi:hypothetical protein